MGLTCASIHIFARGLKAAEKDGGIDRLIQSACQRLGYEDAPEPADGEIRLAAVPGPSWVSVLDPESPLITPALIDLARELSAISAPTLVASVYDSDAFAFLLFERGKQVDGHADGDDLIPIQFKKWSAKKRAQEWSRVFAKTLTPADFQQVIEPASPFADDQLVRLCHLLEIPLAQATLVGQDLTAKPSLAARRYSLRRRNGAGSGLAVTQVVPTGAAASVIEQYTGKTIKFMPLFIQERGHVVFELSGPAEAFVDPVLEISGPAIEQGLIELTGGGTWHGGTTDRIKAGQVCRAEAQWETTDSPAGRIARGRLQGLRARGGPFPPGHQTRMGLMLSVRGKSEGTGEFQVVCRPNGLGSELLSLYPACRVEVTLARWIPRGCQQGNILVDSGIRALNTPTILSGVVIIEDADDAATARVRPLIESWLGSLGKEKGGSVKTRYLGQMNPANFNCPKRKSELPLADVGSGKKWLKLFDEPAKMLGLFLERFEDGAEKPWAGATLQRPFFDPSYNTPGDGTLHTGFWVECASGTEEEMATARGHLIHLIDSVFDGGAGLQGWVARWGWVPLFSTGDENNYSPYEDARGLDRASEGVQGFMARGWCKATLRGLSNTLWLGRDLLARIPRADLERVAQVQPIGTFALRLEIATDDLPQVEEVLEPILPRRGA